MTTPPRHLGNIVPRHPRLLICLEHGWPLPHRPEVIYVLLIEWLVLRTRNVKREKERVGEGVVVRLELEGVSRIHVSAKLDGCAGRGDNFPRGDLLRGGIGHGYVYWVCHAATTGGAWRVRRSEVGRRRAENQIRFVKGLLRWIRGVFSGPFGRNDRIDAKVKEEGLNKGARTSSAGDGDPDVLVLGACQGTRFSWDTKVVLRGSPWESTSLSRLPMI